MGYKNVGFWRGYTGKKAQAAYRNGMLILVLPGYSVAVYEKGVACQFPMWASTDYVALNNTYKDFQKFCLEEAENYAQCCNMANSLNIGIISDTEREIKGYVEGLEVEFV